MSVATIDSNPVFTNTNQPRWQLFAELEEIQQFAQTAGFRNPITGALDTMSYDIWDWARSFRNSVENVRTEAHYLEVYEEYIGLMQLILVDPATQAPLDTNPMYGSDGRTYGQLSMTVVLLMRPPELQRRSPMDEQDPRPFSAVLHPVALKMIAWLIEHDAFLYSPEVEQMLIDLLPQDHMMSTANRIELFLAQREQVSQLRAATETLQMAQLEADIRRLAGEETKTLTAIERQMDERINPLQAVGEQIRLWQQNEDQAIGALRTRVEAHLRRQAEPIMARADAQANLVDATLEAKTRKIAQLREQLQKQMASLEEEMARIEQSNASVAEGHTALKAETRQLEQQILQVKDNIQRLRAQIRKKKADPWKQILTAGAWAAGCGFLTWAAQCVTSTTFGMAIAPTRGGAELKLMLRV